MEAPYHPSATEAMVLHLPGAKKLLLICVYAAGSQGARSSAVAALSSGWELLAKGDDSKRLNHAEGFVDITVSRHDRINGCPGVSEGLTVFQ